MVYCLLYYLNTLNIILKDAFLHFRSRFLPTKRNRTTWKLDREIETSLMKLISHRKESLLEKRRGGLEEENEEEEECHKDLLDVLIRASLKRENNNNNNNNNNNSRKTRITENDIVEECKSFFFAGKHTTSNLMIWTSILLAMHPQWQQLAREEVMRVCGARDIPTKDDVSNLKTVSVTPKLCPHFLFSFCLHAFLSNSKRK